MNDIAAPFRQLVERRLWPLALLLLAALVAVPMMLSKSPAPPAVTAPTASTAAAAQGSTEPIVALSNPEERESVRKVLGSRKNPFRPAIKAKKATKKAATSVTAPATAPTGGTGGTGSLPSPVVVSPTVPSPLQPVSQSYEMYSLRVRFGDSSTSPLESRTLKRLKALPSAEAPALIYLGLLKDRKTAVFLVDGGAKVQGDGRCRPSVADCQTLEMKRGDTAFIDAPASSGSAGTQYQLDLLGIRTRKTTSASAARRSYATVARGGRDALRARVSRVGGLKFDARTGTLKRGAK